MPHADDSTRSACRHRIETVARTSGSRSPRQVSGWFALTVLSAALAYIPCRTVLRADHPRKLIPVLKATSTVGILWAVLYVIACLTA